ncbi:hypothetical protein [Microbispora hainanensis]|uniref:hypothetical protein n=1 Tax=Microbispora hainanensis TaxID=568844 RepID=UPI001ABFDF26|nr:hypothetical protein [Microbispora hainanensis]
MDPRADAPAYAVARAYQRFLDDLREGGASGSVSGGALGRSVGGAVGGASGVLDFAHGTAWHRSIESAVTTP